MKLNTRRNRNRSFFTSDKETAFILTSAAYVTPPKVVMQLDRDGGTSLSSLDDLVYASRRASGLRRGDNPLLVFLLHEHGDIRAGGDILLALAVAGVDFARFVEHRGSVLVRDEHHARVIGDDQITSVR